MYDFEVKTIDGKPLKLSEFKGKVLLIVNTASHCGYTPQYAGLQTLHERYAERGLVVLGFPCNDFGKQEPGTEGEIKSFCESSYGVSFPLMAKVTVKSPDKAPVYKYLTEDTAPEIRGEIKWNFTKFLIGTDGRPVARFEPGTGPLDPALVAALEKALPKK